MKRPQWICWFTKMFQQLNRKLLLSGDLDIPWKIQRFSKFCMSSKKMRSTATILGVSYLEFCCPEVIKNFSLLSISCLSVEFCLWQLVVFMVTDTRHSTLPGGQRGVQWKVPIFLQPFRVWLYLHVLLFNRKRIYLRYLCIKNKRVKVKPGRPGEYVARGTVA